MGITGEMQHLCCLDNAQVPDDSSNEIQSHSHKVSSSGRPPVARKPQLGAHYTGNVSGFSNDDSGQELLCHRIHEDHKGEGIELQRTYSTVSPDNNREECPRSVEQTLQQRNISELRRFSHEQVFELTNTLII